MRLTVNLYLLIGALDIYGEYTSSDTLRLTAKPLLMPALMLFYIASAARPLVTRDRLVIGALVCSWIGDLALMVKGSGAAFFLLGLVGFLIAHLLYIGAFTMVADRSVVPVLRQRLWLAIPLAAYLAALLSVVFPVVDAVMKGPVAVYSLVIGAMAIFALNRYNRVNDSSFALVFGGALLFMFSDSLIAVNKFVCHDRLPMAGVAIMTLYILGQYCISKGMIRNDKLKLT